MLRNINQELLQDQVSMKDATFPAPFPHSLEFNPPVHGTKNIVHIGLGMPEAHQIYVCAINCMRGVVLTAAEMNAADRFSCVVFHEDDLVLGRVEDVTIEGTIDVIRKLPQRPKAVCLFTVCTHHFLGCNLDYIYEKLEEAFPDIDFYRGLMDPIKQKEGLTPDQKLRIAMYTKLHGGPAKRKVSLLGCNYPLAENAEIRRLAEIYDVPFAQNLTCSTYEEFLQMGEAGLLLGIVPNGDLAAEACAKRLGRKYEYLPGVFDFDEIEQEIWTFARDLEALCGDAGHSGENSTDHPGEAATDHPGEAATDHPGEAATDHPGEAASQTTSVCSFDSTLHHDAARTVVSRIIADGQAAAFSALQKAKEHIGDCPIYIDYTVHPRPLGMARMLLSNGFNVKGIYANGLNGEEEADFDWLKEHAPELAIIMTIHPGARIRARHSEEKVLAIGQQAAWFQGTGHFVNIVEGGGLWGYSGIVSLCELMEDAFLNEKDTRQIVPRKGLGCESCV